jgi:DNA-binding PadR family transcriptional regulator
LGSISLKSGLVQKPDRKKSFYEITDKGRQYLANPPEEVESEELERTTAWNDSMEPQKI